MHEEIKSTISNQRNEGTKTSVSEESLCFFRDIESFCSLEASTNFKSTPMIIKENWKTMHSGGWKITWDSINNLDTQRSELRIPMNDAMNNTPISISIDPFTDGMNLIRSKFGAILKQKTDSGILMLSIRLMVALQNISILNSRKGKCINDVPIVRNEVKVSCLSSQRMCDTTMHRECTKLKTIILKLYNSNGILCSEMARNDNIWSKTPLNSNCSLKDIKVWDEFAWRIRKLLTNPLFDQSLKLVVISMEVTFLKKVSLAKRSDRKNHRQGKS